MRLNEITKDKFVQKLKDPRKARIEADLDAFAIAAMQVGENNHKVTVIPNEAKDAGYEHYIVNVIRKNEEQKIGYEPSDDQPFEMFHEIFDTEEYVDLGITTSVLRHEAGVGFKILIRLDYDSRTRKKQRQPNIDWPS